MPNMSNLNQQRNELTSNSQYNSRPVTGVDELTKRAMYRDQLKQQIDQQKSKKSTDKINEQVNDKKYLQEDNFNDAFGKGGAGAPLKDQFGNAITIRQSDLNNHFDRKPIKGILKKSTDKFDYFKNDNLPYHAIHQEDVKNQVVPSDLAIDHSIQSIPNPKIPPYSLPEIKGDYIRQVENPIQEFQQIPPSTTQMQNMAPDQFHQFANQLVLYLHQEKMARQLEKHQKDEEYDREMQRIRNERMNLQSKYERELEQREREYQQMQEDNIKRVNELWQRKFQEERKRRDEMRAMKLKKGQEGEESILLTQSFPNIMEQELRSELQNLMLEIQQNNLLAQQKMNELQEAANRVAVEKQEAEQEIKELNDNMNQMKQDEAIRYKYVYDNLLSEYQDANRQPKNTIPILLPRRKNLNYVADIPNADKLNINTSIKGDRSNYYNTSTDPLYSMKSIGHDVLTTNIQKQRKELGVFDSDIKVQHQKVEQKRYDYDIPHINHELYRTLPSYDEKHTNMQQQNIPHQSQQPSTNPGGQPTQFQISSTEFKPQMMTNPAQQFIPRGQMPQGIPPHMYSQLGIPQPAQMGNFPRPPMYGQMMSSNLINPQGLQLSQQAARFGPQPTIKTFCELHPSFLVLFEDSQAKYCEKCYQEQEEKEKKDIKEEETQEETASSIQSQQTQIASISQPKSKEQQIADLGAKLQNILNSLSLKIKSKAENLVISHEKYSLYEKTLGEKFNPVFHQMKAIINDKRLEYMTFLTKQLNQNKDRVVLEKETIDKLMKSFLSMSEIMKKQLEDELSKIQVGDEQSKKLVDQINKKNDEGEDMKEGEEEKVKVDSYKIEAISTMLDDFDNIIAKNFCLFANYEDFSFAQSRSKEKLAEQFSAFAQLCFTGNFQVKNWFLQGVLPRLFYMQQNTKFLYSYKILHYNSECVLIQNHFSFPEKGRNIVTHDGHLYFIGGYYPIIKHFSKNIFTLDEHRSLLVPFQPMKRGRADHAVIYFKGAIYVFGGMDFANDADKQKSQVQSLNSCEMYSISKDSWQELAPMQHARQQLSACTFNDKYIFVFGGKCLKQNAYIDSIQPFDFVNEVEVYDIDRNNWKVINYISDKDKLRVLHSGMIQITGKKIMIFGGLTSIKNGQDELTAEDNGQKVTISNQCYHLDVTTGNIKRGPDLQKACYFVCGGNLFTHSNRIYAFGLGSGKEQHGFQSSLGATSSASFLNPNLSKKVLLCYKVGENEWSEVQEGIFSGPRRISFESLDEF